MLFFFIMSLIVSIFTFFARPVKRTGYILLFLLFLTFQVQGILKDNNILFRNYDTSNGLPHNNINCIFQDKAGYIWIGTASGLCRYDGYEFLSFKIESEYIENESVISIVQKDDSALFVCTQNVLYDFDLNKYAFKPVNFDTKDINFSVLFNDTIRNGIWVCTRNKGVYFINDRGFKNYKNPMLNSDIGYDSEKNIWISSYSSGMWRYNPKEDVFENSMLINNNVSCFSFYSDSLLIAGTRGKGLIKVNLADQSNISQRLNSELNSRGNVITKIVHNKNQLLIGTDGGLFIYDLENNSYKKYLHNPVIGNSLTDDFVRSIFSDSEGGTWIGTFFRGISYIPAVTKGFKSMTPNPWENSINGSIVSAFYELDENRLCIATEDDGMSIFDKRSNVFGRLPQYSRANFDNIHAITKVKDELWIGTILNGVEKYNLINNKTNYLKQRPGDRQSLYGNMVYDFYKIDDSKVFIATNNGVVLCEDGHRIKRIFETFGMGCRDIVKHKNDYWFVSRNNGLCKLETSDSTFHFYNKQNNKIYTNLLSCATVDDNNDLWVASLNNGIHKYSPEKDQFVQVRFDESNSSNLVFSMECLNNELWLGTISGLVRYNIPNKSTVTYTEKDGLASSYFNSNASLKTKDNRLLFGTVRGYIEFDPVNIRSNAYKPIPLITKISFRNRKTNSEYSVIEPEKMDYVQLDYASNNIEFSFSSLSFNNTEANRFKYILIGSDGIVQRTNKNYVQYSNLPHGEYLFKVWGSNDDLVWSSHPAYVKIKIFPPFLQSKLAFVLYFFVLLGLVMFIYIIMRKRETIRLKRNIELANYENDKKLSQFRINFFTNLAHEIKTPLTLIKTPLEVIMSDDKLPKKFHPDLNVMYSNTNRLLKLINQLLEFRKIEENKYTLHCKNADIVDLLKKIFLRFKPYADGRNIEFELLTDSNFYSIVVDSDALIMVISNLLTNAFKFASNKVTVSLAFGNEHITEIQIEDDGPGIPDKELQRIFLPFEQLSRSNNFKGVGLGLAFCKALVELHKGELILSNRKSGGLRAIIRLNNHLLSESSDSDAIQRTEETESVTETEITGDASLINNPGTESALVNKFKTQNTILLVDDNTELLRYIEKALHSEFKIVTARNGEDALQYLAQCEKEPDIIISDVAMPVIDGISFCREIKNNSNLSHIPVILLTAKTTDNDKLEGIKVGADAYLTKPFNFDILKAQIVSLIEKSKNSLAKNNNKSYVEYSTGLTETDSKLINELISIIESDIKNPSLSVEYLSEKLSMSRFTLYKKVKSITKNTPKDFIAQIRISKAAELICTTDSPIKEIAFQTGFINISHFSITFKKQFGCSPSEYRNKNKG